MQAVCFLNIKKNKILSRRFSFVVVVMLSCTCVREREKDVPHIHPSIHASSHGWRSVRHQGRYVLFEVCVLVSGGFRSSQLPVR